MKSALNYYGITTDRDTIVLIQIMLRAAVVQGANTLGNNVPIDVTEECFALHFSTRIQYENEMGYSINYLNNTYEGG